MYTQLTHTNSDEPVKASRMVLMHKGEILQFFTAKPYLLDWRLALTTFFNKFNFTSFVPRFVNQYYGLV